MIWVVQNDARVPSGHFGEELRGWCVPHRTVRLFAGEAWPAAADGDGIIVLGGYMGAHDGDTYHYLATAVEGLRRAAMDDVPVLGICLGGQLLARALGAAVHAGRGGETGLRPLSLTAAAAEDPLFAGFAAPLAVLQWHRDSFDLPRGAVRLAWSPSCPNQAFRYRRAYGVQFHPEVNRQMVADWVILTGEEERLVVDFDSTWGRYRLFSRRLLANFLELCAADVTSAVGAGV